MVDKPYSKWVVVTKNPLEKGPYVNIVLLNDANYTSYVYSLDNSATQSQLRALRNERRVDGPAKSSAKNPFNMSCSRSGTTLIANRVLTDGELMSRGTHTNCCPGR